MMKGSFEYLTGKDPAAAYLRDCFVFLVAPMLNPDGVMLGNNRYDSYGNDLNRVFHLPNRNQQPAIYYLKKMIHELSKDTKLVFYCDMHGHGKSKDIFAYGNNEGAFSGQYKAFPLILSEICPIFSFSKCCFAVDKVKESTARIVIWREFSLCNVFTLEASFFGSTSDNRQYSANDYMEVGKKVCVAIAIMNRLRLLQWSADSGYNENEYVAGYVLKDICEAMRAKRIFEEDMSLEKDHSPDVKTHMTSKCNSGYKKSIKAILEKPTYPDRPLHIATSPIKSKAAKYKRNRSTHMCLINQDKLLLKIDLVNQQRVNDIRLILGNSLVKKGKCLRNVSEEGGSKINLNANAFNRKANNFTEAIESFYKSKGVSNIKKCPPIVTVTQTRRTKKVTA
eukprot:TRINITY_DN12876_c0_g1_i2.p1 TRINITY_DN12876_c0_g1~~TRINITY_DN12876_c0_g1_i2.p1  ORF type:complete len:394 (-),score=65.77 TRINITY_DN12876_c0_g1_i2:359-1540(-)